MEEMNVPQARRHSFQTALYQFLFPLVDYGPNRMPIRMFDRSLVDEFDSSIFEDLDSPPDSLPSSTSLERPRLQMQSKDVGPVKRPPLPLNNQPAQSSSSSSRATTQKKNPPKPSAVRSKRSLSISTGSGQPEGSQPKKRTRKESTVSRDKLKNKRESHSLIRCFDRRLFLLCDPDVCS